MKKIKKKESKIGGGRKWIDFAKSRAEERETICNLQTNLLLIKDSERKHISFRKDKR
jgi:hypothetical protein